MSTEGRLAARLTIMSEPQTGVLFARADAALNEGEYEEAMDLVRRWTEGPGPDPRASSLFGKCLVNQREIVTHTRGFKPALRAALREDPDIVLVGEMRDLETIAIAIETAETGHLVFGTLHTSTACSTVDRIIDQFPADRQAQIRTMLSESLKGVIAQTLVKKIGGGRAAALEVLIVTLAIANLIREAKTFQIVSLMQTGRQHGMRLLNDALFELVKSGTVDANEAYRKAVDKSSLAAAYRKANIRFDPVADS